MGWITWNAALACSAATSTTFACNRTQWRLGIDRTIRMSATVVSAYKTNCQLAPIKSHKAEVHSAKLIMQKVHSSSSDLWQILFLTTSACTSGLSWQAVTISRTNTTQEKQKTSTVIKGNTYTWKGNKKKWQPIFFFFLPINKKKWQPNVFFFFFDR